jgi:hypothetical protein
VSVESVKRAALWYAHVGWKGKMKLRLGLLFSNRLMPAASGNLRCLTLVFPSKAN